jgi:hypothetical protein
MAIVRDQCGGGAIRDMTKEGRASEFGLKGYADAFALYLVDGAIEDWYVLNSRMTSPAEKLAVLANPY